MNLELFVSGRTLGDSSLQRLLRCMTFAEKPPGLLGVGFPRLGIKVQTRKIKMGQTRPNSDWMFLCLNTGIQFFAEFTVFRPDFN